MPPLPEDHPDSTLGDLFASLLEQLACPVCFAAMSLQKNGLLCTGCGRVFPVEDGIPVLIADRAAAGPGDPDSA